MNNAAAAFTGAAPAAAPAAPAPTAAAPAPIAAGPAAPPASNAAWYDTFENADVKTWTAAKGFKDASAVAESAYNLEKLIGFDKAGRTIVMPKDDASPDELKAFHAKLGVPETPEGYKLPLPETADPAFGKAIQGWMHKAGVTPKAAEVLTQEFVAFSAAQQEAESARLLEQSNQVFSKTMQAWGKDADGKMELGKRFAANLIPDEVTLDSGEKVKRGDFIQQLFDRTGATGALLELFAQAGSGMGEHKMRSNGESSFGGMSPQAAKIKIDQLKADQGWVTKYLHGDKEKVEEMQRLTALAYPVE